MSQQVAIRRDEQIDDSFPWWGYVVILFTYFIAFKVFFPTVIQAQFHAIDFFFAPLDLIHTSVWFDLLSILIIIGSTFLIFLAPLGLALFFIREMQKQ